MKTLVKLNLRFLVLHLHIDGRLNPVKLPARPLSSSYFHTYGTAVTKTSFHSAPLNPSLVQERLFNSAPSHLLLCVKENSQANSQRAM